MKYDDAEYVVTFNYPDVRFNHICYVDSDETGIYYIVLDTNDGKKEFYYFADDWKGALQFTNAKMLELSTVIKN